MEHPQFCRTAFRADRIDLRPRPRRDLVASDVGDATNCFAGMLAVTDPKSFGGSVCHTWNCDPIWLARLPDHAEEIHIPESFLARSR